MKRITLLLVCLFLNSMNAQNNLRVLTGMGSRLYDINDDGEAVHSGGYYSYSTDTSTPIESVAEATNRLNNATNIAGSMPFTALDGSILSQAAYRKNGVWNAIGFFPGDTPGNSWFGEAKGISSNSLLVAGQMTSVNAGTSYPFIYNTVAGTNVKLTGDLTYHNGRAADVNDNGIVAGWVDREDLFNIGTFRVPIYFDTNGGIHYIDFGTPEYGEANDVNNAGQVVGYKGNKAFIYDTNTSNYQAFDAPAGYSDAVFLSISENGIAVGYCGTIGDRETIIYHPSLGANPILLTDFLTSQNIPITTFDTKLGTGMSISSNGKYICGFDNSIPPIFASGWVVNLENLILSTNDTVKNNKFNFSVYPNPVKDILNIYSEKTIRSLSIFDASGKLMTTEKSIDKNNIKIDLSMLATGVYLGNAILDGEMAKTFKIIKK